MPVPASGSGKGLPYPAEDWPGGYLGLEGWKKSLKKSGLHQDRHLIAPDSLQERPGRQLWFGSKLSVERYIRSKFPNANINPFFASFTWDIAVQATSQSKGQFRFNLIHWHVWYFEDIVLCGYIHSYYHFYAIKSALDSLISLLVIVLSFGQTNPVML